MAKRLERRCAFPTRAHPAALLVAQAVSLSSPTTGKNAGCEFLRPTVKQARRLMSGGRLLSGPQTPLSAGNAQRRVEAKFQYPGTLVLSLHHVGGMLPPPGQPVSNRLIIRFTFSILLLIPATTMAGSGGAKGRLRPRLVRMEEQLSAKAQQEGATGEKIRSRERKLRRRLAKTRHELSLPRKLRTSERGRKLLLGAYNLKREITALKQELDVVLQERAATRTHRTYLEGASAALADLQVIDELALNEEDQQMARWIYVRLKASSARDLNSVASDAKMLASYLRKPRGEHPLRARFAEVSSERAFKRSMVRINRAYFQSRAMAPKPTAVLAAAHKRGFGQVDKALFRSRVLAPKASAVLAAAHAMSGMSMEELNSAYFDGNTGSSEARAMMTAAHSITKTSMEDLNQAYFAANTSSREAAGILAVAHAMTKVPMEKLNKAFLAANTSWPEASGLLAAAHAMTGMPIEDLKRSYFAGKTRSHEARAVLAAAHAMTGMPTEKLNKAFFAANSKSDQARAVLAAAHAVTGVPMEELNKAYFASKSALPKGKAIMAAARAFQTGEKMNPALAKRYLVVLFGGSLFAD
jgi:hypothetical protein